MQFSDFVACGFDQLVNVAGKLHYRTGLAAPLVAVLLAVGGARALAGLRKALHALPRYTEHGDAFRSWLFAIAHNVTIDGDWGLSVIEYGAKVFGSALAASTAANGTFERGLSPTVAFKMAHVLKKEQREEFRASLDRILSHDRENHEQTMSVLRDLCEHQERVTEKLSDLATARRTG